MSHNDCGLASCVTHVAWALVGAFILAAWLLWPDAKAKYRWHR